MAAKSSLKGKGKKKKVNTDVQRQLQMPIVTVDVCLKCTQICERGRAYMEKMSHPGAIGYGVPCVLRRK